MVWQHSVIVLNKMATSGSFPHGNTQFPFGVYNIKQLKDQFERNKNTIVLIEKRIDDLTRAGKEVHKKEIRALRIHLTVQSQANLGIKI